MNTRCAVKLSLLLVAILLSIHAYGQNVCFCYKGAWSEWKNWGDVPKKYVDNTGFVLKTSGGIEYFSFRITGYQAPNSRQRKRHMKSDEWYVYTGTITYYVNDTYPTADDLARCCTLVKPDPRNDTTPSVKRTAKATISIAPYKKHPECYNIWFDGVGVGFSISRFKFSWK